MQAPPQANPKATWPRRSRCLSEWREIKDHADRGHNVRDRSKDAHQQVAHLPGISERRGKPKQVAVISEVLHQVNADHDQHDGIEQSLPKRGGLGRIEFAGFFAEGRFKMVALLGGNPTRLRGDSHQ